MSVYKRITTELDIKGITRTVHVIWDSVKQLPHFEANMWAMWQFDTSPDYYYAKTNRVVEFLNFCHDKHIPFTEFDTIHFTAYLEKYRKGELGNSAATLKMHALAVQEFMAAMQEMGFVDHVVETPTNFLNHETKMDLAKQAAKSNSLDPFGLHRKVYSREEFDLFLGYVRRHTSVLTERERLGMELAYQTGVRAQEVVDRGNFTVTKLRKAKRDAQLERERPDWVSLNIMGKGSKSRQIDIPIDLVDRMLRHHKNFQTTKNITTDLIFCTQEGKPIEDRGHFTKRYKETLDALIDDNDEELVPTLGLWIQYRKDRTFHSLRHCYATNTVKWLQTINDGPLARDWNYLRQTMGHNQIDTTMIYVHYMTDIHGSAEERDQLLRDIAERERGSGYRAAMRAAHSEFDDE